ncbi:MAG: hypothetical protein HRT68_17100, partial [Flavobacteriaceae bacterium]|nr:hypothetical protein [Flavobacteriaceae bacterium]
MALSFSNTSDNLSLYIASTQSSFWCAFLLPEGTKPDKASLSFEETAQYNGYYLFSSSTPENKSDFVTHAWSYFESIAIQCQAGGIAWFTDPNATLSSNNVTFIYFLEAS